MAGRKTITVYPGSDASFTLYEDDGDTYAYEQGHCHRTLIEWNDRKQKLTISHLENGKKTAADSNQFDIRIIEKK
ncbi:MAG: DUF5110 domain-containing protein [Bacteroidaceae bacterium]